MSWYASFAQPWYTGAGTTSEVPGRFPFAVNGLGYAIDERKGLSRQSIPGLRPQADTGAEPAEQSLNPQDLWRRFQESWDRGAGQDTLDRADSDRRRFRTSKGVDVWTRWELGLLPDTAGMGANTAAFALAMANGRLYAAAATAPFLQYTTNGTTWTTVTGLPASAPMSMATDGFHIWTAHGADGIYQHDADTSTSSSYVTGPVSRVGYVRGRLMASFEDKLYNIAASGALPAALLDHPNSGFRWEGFAEGPGNVYCFGSALGSADRALVYRTAIKPDGASLDVPVVAAKIPPGEFAYAMGSEGGLGILGLSTGWRPFLAEANGDLTLGPLVRTGSAVRALAVQGRFAWYGLTNYDGASTGLGRADLSTDTAAGTSRDGAVPVPAYASDLMATGQGNVTAVVDWFDRRVFAVPGLGVFGQSATGVRVPSGTIDSGLVTFGLPLRKTAVSVETRFRPLPAGASVATAMATDSGAFNTLGTAAGAGTAGRSWPADLYAGETFELRETLSRATATATGPAFTRHTLSAFVVPRPGILLTVPVKLFSSVLLDGDSLQNYDPISEVERFDAYRVAGSLVSIQEHTRAYRGFVVDYRWDPEHDTPDGQDSDGVLTVVFNIPSLVAEA
jgi:hypothetical protein